MTTIKLPCPDGSDSHCWGDRTFDIGLNGLTEDQLSDIETGEGQATIELTEEQVKANGLLERDIYRCPVENRIFMEVSLNTTCPHCGKDQ